MKHIRCPKCDELVPFDPSAYEAGQTLVFECPQCHKQFRIRIPEPKVADEAPERAALAHLIVIENVFHFKQDIPLYAGRNVIGRYVKGTKANAAIRTNDPSIDTTHSVLTIAEKKDGSLRYTLQDGPSNTGTFVMDHLLGNRESVSLKDGDIITLGATTIIFRTNEGLENDETD